jgi:hypothetical protein
LGRIDLALGYVRLGWPVLALRPDGKEPLARFSPEGVKSATVDQSEVTRWFRSVPDVNIGIRCSSFVVIDIDPRNGGDETMRAWVELHGRLPTTPVARTGSGGLHYLFRTPSFELRGKAGNGVDVKSKGGYIVAAPSIVKGRPYRWLRDPSTPLAELPAWLQSLVKREEPAPRVPVGDLQEVALERRIERARAYLERVEPAIQGQNGSAVTFVAVQHVVLGFMLPEAPALMALADWNARCQPPWTERELKRKIGQALSGAGRTVRPGQHLAERL